MTVAPSASNRSTSRAVPKPTFRPLIEGRAARAAVEIQGRAMADVAADLDARQAGHAADHLDERRDPLLPEIVRIFVAIKGDLGTSARSRELAKLGLAKALEAIRLDRLHDEHRKRQRDGIDLSIAEGRAVIGGIDGLIARPACDDETVHAAHDGCGFAAAVGGLT